MNSGDEHAASEQETAIYQALTIGDQDAISDMRSTAYTADPSRPPDAPENWLSPAAQYQLDYGYAWNHYQADHEPPDAEREAATQTAVGAENDIAAGRGEPSGLR